MGSAGVAIVSFCVGGGGGANREESDLVDNPTIHGPEDEYTFCHDVVLDRAVAPPLFVLSRWPPLLSHRACQRRQK